MAEWLQTLATALEYGTGGQEKMVDDIVDKAIDELDVDGPAKSEAKRQLKDAINGMLEGRNVNIPKLQGIVGLPAQWFAAILSAGSEMMTPEVIDYLKDYYAENEPADLVVWVPTIEFERTYAVKLVCVDGRLVREREFVGEVESPDEWDHHRYKNVNGNSVMEMVAQRVRTLKGRETA